MGARRKEANPPHPMPPQLRRHPKPQQVLAPGLLTKIQKVSRKPIFYIKLKVKYVNVLRDFHWTQAHPALEEIPHPSAGVRKKYLDPPQTMAFCQDRTPFWRLRLSAVGFRTYVPEKIKVISVNDRKPKGTSVLILKIEKCSSSLSV